MPLPNWSRSMTINLVFGHRWQTPFTVLYMSKENTACKTKKIIHLQSAQTLLRDVASTWKKLRFSVGILYLQELNNPSIYIDYDLKIITSVADHAQKLSRRPWRRKFGDPQIRGSSNIWLAERERKRDAKSPALLRRSLEPLIQSS
jgi:hypothetical protein